MNLEDFILNELLGAVEPRQPVRLRPDPVVDRSRGLGLLTSAVLASAVANGLIPESHPIVRAVGRAVAGGLGTVAVRKLVG
jgi:hypothetical protein